MFKKLLHSIVAFGVLFVLCGLLLFVIANWSALALKVRYWIDGPRADQTAVVPMPGPIIRDQLTIAKIGVTAPLVFPDRNDEQSMLLALQKGIVHYADSALPGSAGSVVLTGHSSQSPWEAGDYKSVFALLEKLQPGDTIALDYQDRHYTYRVSQTKKIDPRDRSILEPQDNAELVLITCWPTGTSLRRLVVLAEPATY
ncbi:MAG: class D sortase [Candidatus Andersenbacteria bacterium]